MSLKSLFINSLWHSVDANAQSRDRALSEKRFEFCGELFSAEIAGDDAAFGIEQETHGQGGDVVGLGQGRIPAEGIGDLRPGNAVPLRRNGPRGATLVQIDAEDFESKR